MLTPRRALPILALLSASSCRTVPEWDGSLPETVHACETHNARVCSTWTRSAEGYHSRFDQGTEADLTVVRFDRDSVVLRRTDRKPGVAPFTTAIYRAAPDGRRVHDGIVTWRQSGVEFSGPWTAEW